MWQVRWLCTSVQEQEQDLPVDRYFSLSLSLKPGYCYWTSFPSLLLLTVLAFLRGWSMNVAGISV